jgi:CDP-6-deoxy-D-xylo-4-hexulose-3-dehydrase
MRIADLAAEWVESAKAKAPPFVAGETYIPPAKLVAGGAEISNLVYAALEGWWTEGHWTDEFEQAFAKYLGVRCASMVNSGSSANLLAIGMLRSRMIERMFDMDGRTEIITAATGFPTTLNPILQFSFTPVLVDVRSDTLVPDWAALREAITERTAAIIVAHTLGNPVDLGPIVEHCDRLGIAIIEDNCDALGSKIKGRLTGTIGTAATHSFYPAHHISTGEGGMVVTRHPLVKRIVESLRDWGRDCWCAPGKENTCGKRFEWDFAGLPEGYDHKYVYSNIGFNLKSTDLQAAIGVAQLKRADTFRLVRVANFNRLYGGLRDLAEFFLLPKATDKSEPSWFGFPLRVRESAPFGRRELIEFLTERKIGTRAIFAGNLARQPAYNHVVFKVPRPLRVSDAIAEDGFWIGVHPGLTVSMVDYVIETFHDFARRR